jgi:DNA-directed RNA polymerase subunit RPC12/RpoP
VTESEAIKICNTIIFASSLSNPQGTALNTTKEELAEAMGMAMQALEKQIPKKPITKQYFEDSEEKYLRCPTCGEILTDRIPADNKTFYFHCMNCGQKFDWDDSE